MTGMLIARGVPGVVDAVSAIDMDRVDNMLTIRNEILLLIDDSLHMGFWGFGVRLG